jgi:hypothetical protein
MALVEHVPMSGGVKTLSWSFSEAMFVDLVDKLTVIFLHESFQFVHGARSLGDKELAASAFSELVKTR